MDLVNEHQNDCSVTPCIPGKESEGVGMGEELVTIGPIHSSRRWKSKGEYIESGNEIYELEFLRLPHCMHDFPVNNTILESLVPPITRANYDIQIPSSFYFPPKD